MVVDSGALRGVRHGFVAVLAVGSARCWPAPGCSPRSPSGPNTWPPHRAIRRSTAAPAPAGARQVVDITGMIITADALRRLRVGAQINPVTALEVVGEVVDQSLVEVVPVQVRYGGLYLDHPVADIQNTDIDGAELEDQHRLVLRRTRRNHHRRPVPSGGVRPCRAFCSANAFQTAGSQTATPRYAGAPRTAGPALPAGLPAIVVTVDIDTLVPPHFPWNPTPHQSLPLALGIGNKPRPIGGSNPGFSCPLCLIHLRWTIRVMSGDFSRLVDRRREGWGQLRSSL